MMYTSIPILQLGVFFISPFLYARVCTPCLIVEMLIIIIIIAHLLINTYKQMKQCPRCKRPLQNPSRHQKIVCKACGYVTRNIQVARDNQQFQERHNFGKKVTHRTSNEQRGRQVDEDGQQHGTSYLFAFQAMLKMAATNIGKHAQEYKNVEYYTRYLWISYLSLVSQHGIEITGMYRKTIKFNNKDNKNIKNNSSIQNSGISENEKEQEVEDDKKQEEQNQQWLQQYDYLNNKNKKCDVNSMYTKRKQGDQLQYEYLDNKMQEQQDPNKNPQINITHQQQHDKLKSKKSKTAKGNKEIQKKYKSIDQQQYKASSSRHKRGRKKKKEINQALSTHEQKRISLKSQIRRKVVQLQHRQQQLQPIEQANTLLQFLYNLPMKQDKIQDQDIGSPLQLESQNQLSPQLIDYMANKYCIYLVKNLRMYNLNIGSSYSFVKGRPLKLTHKELEILMRMRNLKFVEKTQMIVVIMLQDLLKIWAQQISLSDQLSLQNLLLLYKSDKNTYTNPLITAAISHLKNLIKKQAEHQLQVNKPQFPQLSMNLLYSILYLGVLLAGHALNIDDIMIYAGKLSRDKIDVNWVGNGRLCSKTIRKTAALLMSILNIKCEPDIHMISKWIEKESKICGFTDKEKNFAIKIGEILYGSYKINNKNKKLWQKIERRYQFIQQDMMAKAILVIVLKLELGFQDQPFLSIYPIQIISLLKQTIQSLPSKREIQSKQTVSKQNNNQNQQKNYIKYIPLLEHVSKMRRITAKVQISVNNVLSNIENYYTCSNQTTKMVYNKSINRASLVKILYPCQGYSSLQGLDINALIQLNQMYKNNSAFNFSFSANLVYNISQKPNIQSVEIIKKRKKLTKKVAGQPLKSVKQPQICVKLKKQFRKQLKYALEDYKENTLSYKQLDFPCTNYQFFYEYMSNIKHVGRDLFVLFVETLAAGLCPLAQLYGWVQAFQGVLVQFQN